MQPKDIETLEKAGGLILDQLVATRTISAEQQTQILDQQSRIAQDTGEKPYVGELLEQNGIDTANIKQPLLDMQASARTLLHAYGEPEAAARAEGGYGNLDLKDGVPDNKWTVKDLESGDPAKERTALLQTRLVQTKVLSTAANMLEANGAEVPAATLTALRASQDAGREGLNAAVKDLQAAGQDPEAVQHTLNALPAPMNTVSQAGIQQGLNDAIDALQSNDLLSKPQADILKAQEAKRGSDIDNLRARQQTRSDVGTELNTKFQDAAPAPSTSRADAIRQQQSTPQSRSL